MFNEYTVFQMMKLRQEETERAAKNAWKFFANPSEMENSKQKVHHTKPAANPCCQCACA